MKLNLISTAASLILASAAHEGIRPATESPPAGTIVLGGVEHKYLSRRIPETDSISNFLQLYGLDIENKAANIKHEKDTSLDLVHLELNKNKPRLFASRSGYGAVDANLDPTGRSLAVEDIGADSVIPIDTTDDAYKVRHDASIMVSGCGPRHGILHPHGAETVTGYIIACATSNQVFVYFVKCEIDQLVLK
ncbi:hypothetical protein FALBO_4619 [Fusarium albosuccineum]|uniref:Uncharacterized protein n=1 Tax=Fusarium albosuccineum TaxID=1237068 RepID=A0A8H4LFJ3_9HYPO|nr:hypothetical protein FALBO_4619 [Fusarium albosuccineum]